MSAPSKASVRATYETIAASYASSRREPWPEVLAFVSRLPQGSTVLDVGCGHGRHAGPIAARGMHVIGVDFARSLMTLGLRGASMKRWTDRMEWIEADASSLPLRTHVVDACICVAVLHHLPTLGDRLAVLQEIRRVLRPDRRVFVSAWALEQARFDAIRRERRGLAVEVCGDVEIPWPLPDGRSVPRYYHLFQRGELERIIIESGLLGETFFISSGNYFAEARSPG